ncbi:ATP-binding cassette domain-containing protein [Treponema sp.]|uniref:ABC transporter ATP-binding protein n=2 Tax=Treponema rectale TaxID=744512 RepID=A0A7M1XQV1_9SPIR|nr:ATP-binding cassette domain-containing protein [Treponema sp.]MBE6353406.1 ABC transporter ATP-binding protein [Treponema sp.]QOS41178.1 ABC transporter ATP-binding protein [Treponema rectale]
MNSDTLLSVKNISMNFRTKNGIFNAVKNVSLDIKKGEVLGLVGESGCGKTTTGRCIINLYKVSDGEIFFNGELINSKKTKLKINPKIQMIFQDPSSSLNPRMTVKEIIGEGLIIQGEKNKNTIQQKVNEVLLKVGLLPEYADRYPHEFSGGQKQRIGIARALIMKPELIIADEPVSALDVSIKAQIINLLNDLRKELNIAILFIAHDLSITKYFSDRIAVMRQGTILETADSDELFKNPVNPYTKSLLDAIPLADPDAELSRTSDRSRL